MCPKYGPPPSTIHVHFAPAPQLAATHGSQENASTWFASGRQIALSRHDLTGSGEPHAHINNTHTAAIRTTDSVSRQVTVFAW